MSEPYVGAKVTIKAGSEFDYGTCANPSGVVGVVIEVETEPKNGSIGWWKVKWPNGSTNHYREQDLKILGTVIKEEN